LQHQDESQNLPQNFRQRDARQLVRKFFRAECNAHPIRKIASKPAPERVALEKYKGAAALFNKIGAACRQAGLQLAYHNHDFEFEKVGGKIPYEVLLAEADPQLMQMEIDLFWIRKGGQEARAYFAKYPGRFPLCHVKDMDTNGKMAEVGK
jgi:sugar phosphate isomerase/epimerase